MWILLEHTQVFADFAWKTELFAIELVYISLILLFSQGCFGLDLQT